MKKICKWKCWMYLYMVILSVECIWKSMVIGNLVKCDLERNEGNMLSMVNWIL